MVEEKKEEKDVQTDELKKERMNTDEEQEAEKRKDKLG